MIYVQQIRKASREAEADPVEAIRSAVRTILPVPIAVNALTAELAILYDALFLGGQGRHPCQYSGIQRLQESRASRSAECATDCLRI